MAASDPKARTRNARIAANVGWARTPNRTERMAAAHRNSPMSFEYWRTHIKEEHPNIPRTTQLKMANNAHTAYMQQLSLKAVAARRAKKAPKPKRGAA